MFRNCPKSSLRSVEEAHSRTPSRPAAILLSILVSFTASFASAESGMPRTASPEGAQVYFITPEDGQTVTSPVLVRFGLRKMGVAPAGVVKPATGHHHLVVDAELPPDDLPIPSTDQYRHFGNGQTEFELDLAPGKHTLQLLLGDQNHVPHKPPVVSEQITIIVKE